MDLADALGDEASNPQQADQLKNPAWPGQPAQPAWPGQQQPAWPGQPSQPTWPGQPGQPTWPGQPGQPGQPTWPGQPSQPGQPTWPGQPGQPGQPTWPGQPGQPNAPGWPGAAPPTAPQIAPLIVPYNMPLPGGMYNKMVCTIEGKVKPNASKFSINLYRNRDIAFHFNPRFNEDGRQVIVRNTMINDVWGQEERAAPSFPLAAGKPFEMKILCTPTEFKVAVNKSHLLEYKHRIRELNQITKLNVVDDVELTAVNVETLP